MRMAIWIKLEECTQNQILQTCHQSHVVDTQELVLYGGAVNGIALPSKYFLFRNWYTGLW